MRKRLFQLILMLFTVICFYHKSDVSTAWADETGTGNQTTTAPISFVSIGQSPSKTTYYQGENLDFSDLKLQVSYTDGTSAYVTDYTLTGYDSSRIGVQTITISYQGFSFNIDITVLPAKVKNIKVTACSMNSVTLTWDAIPSITTYEIYTQNPYSGTYDLSTTTATNSVTLNLSPATTFSIQICGVSYSGYTQYRSPLSDVFTGATAPDAVSGLNVTGTTATSVSLSWNPVAGATGYVIYRSSNAGIKYAYCNQTTATTFSDKKVSSGTSYQYQVYAYVYSKDFRGIASNMVDTSTTPARLSLKCKAGDQKVRITWKAVTGATSYDIYIGDDYNGYVTYSKKASGACSYTIDGLTTGQTYHIYASARRNYNAIDYLGQSSVVTDVSLNELPNTSTKAKIFTDLQKFKNSASYTSIAFFKKNVNYSQSYIMPGMSVTNVGGFTSTQMCPQGIVFAGDFLLMTAYDKAEEENSVIYVMDKKTKALLTTIILPEKTHAGGVAYDGTNIWVTKQNKVSSIPFDEIENAANEGLPYYKITYNTTCTLDITASYLTYYDDKLWAGAYDELNETLMYSYFIEDKDTTPTLIEGDQIDMPTRVQGIAFTKEGVLILSRSCQRYKGLRGYMRQLDIYRPDFNNTVDGIIPIGDPINTVEMPSMNEGIDISGAYLYVCYESVAFEDASYKMDRICAFKLSSLYKK